MVVVFEYKTLVNVANTTGLNGGEEEKEIVVFVYMVWSLLMVTSSVSLQRKNTRASSFYRCFSILRSHECGILYTRFHTFYVPVNMELHIHAFIHLYGGEKQVLIFFSIPVARDIGQDYTSQSRSEFDWYNPPHLYNY